MPSFYEFFAGAGLARSGLEPSWTCVWANDISEKKARVYRRNFGDDHLVVGDVADVDPSSLPPGAELAWASFPCQDLSLAGWRRGMQARRSGAFWAFWRLMADRHDHGDRPNIIVIENVVGLLSGDNLTGLCDALAALGMTFGALVIDAKYFLPQSRPRVFIVAVDAGIPITPFAYNEAQPTSSWTPASLRGDSRRRSSVLVMRGQGHIIRSRLSAGWRRWGTIYRGRSQPQPGQRSHHRRGTDIPNIQARTTVSMSKTHSRTEDDYAPIAWPQSPREEGGEVSYEQWTYERGMNDGMTDRPCGGGRERAPTRRCASTRHHRVRSVDGRGAAARPRPAGADRARGAERDGTGRDAPRGCAAPLRPACRADCCRDPACGAGTSGRGTRHRPARDAGKLRPCRIGRPRDAQGL